MSDDAITLWLETFWDVDVPGVEWDESGRTVHDRATAVAFMLNYKAGRPPCGATLLRPKVEMLQASAIELVEHHVGDVNEMIDE